MPPEFNRTLIWLVQTVFVGVLVVMLGGVFGIEFLFVDFGREGRSLLRIVLFLLLAAGSVFFLFWNVSQLIDEKLDESQAESVRRTGFDEATE